MKTAKEKYKKECSFHPYFLSKKEMSGRLRKVRNNFPARQCHEQTFLFLNLLAHGISLF